MRRNKKIGTAAGALAILAVGFAAAGWRASRSGPPAASDRPVTAQPYPATPSPALAALQDSPQTAEYRRRAAFERDARAFFAEAAALGAAERDERARSLSAQLDHYESIGGLSAGEAMVLRTALVQATVDDPARRTERMAEIVERYRSHAERRMAAHAARQHSDPRFQTYKAREAQVVAEVMAMPAIPGGMTRDAYLRQRLQEERERAYAP